MKSEALWSRSRFVTQAGATARRIIIKVGLISAGLAFGLLDSSILLLKAFNHEYHHSHYQKPCILTKVADHLSSSLGNEADYWTNETWENSRDLTSKSPKIIFNSFDHRFQASCQCAHNQSNRCFDCEYNNWDRQAIPLEHVSHSLSCWSAFFKFFSLILNSLLSFLFLFLLLLDLRSHHWQSPDRPE